jgi:hypothetical protein
MADRRQLARQAGSQGVRHYDWAEPGDPPNHDFASVKAAPVTKPIPYPSLTPERELELILAYHEDGDLDALDQLVGAHRPMVVRMAKTKRRGNGTTLKALVEYGMLGLRLAAEPPRPSLTKKGKLVGFNPADGHRFSTYARHYADKEMRAALAFDPPALKDNEFPKASVEVENWHTAPSLRGILPDTPEVVRELMGGEHPAPHQPRPWTLWNPTFTPQQPRPRNYRAHPVTETELAGRDLFYGVQYLVLQTYEDLAAQGMDGWGQGREDSYDLDDWWFPSIGALEGKQYRLPRKVLMLRHRMGCKRDGQIIPFKTNAGLGLYDRRGHRLPDYTFVQGKVVVIRNRQFTPFLCRFPVASIYLVGGEINGEEGEIISWRRLWTTEHSRWLQNATRNHSSPYTCPQHSSKPLTRSQSANSARVLKLSANQ